MRSLYFTAAESGLTRAQLRHGEAAGRWTKICRATYRKGPEPPTELDRCLAGFPCTDPLQTLIDLAAILDDDHWEQALESALRRRQVSLSELEAVLPVLSRRRLAGVVGIRRVLERRPAGAPATGSRLETVFVQLVRRHLDVEAPRRQVEIRDQHGDFVAYVDVAWPELGLFIELDGQHHADQPVHDARRETAVVAATAWLVGRFTWQEIVRHPVATARRLEALLARARERTNA